MPRALQPIVHIFHSYEEMNRSDREEDLRMTPDERMAILAALRRQFYGDNCPDVREAERAR